MTKARDIASAAPAPSTVSATEIGYLDGVTSAIQTQLDAKTAKSTLTTTGDIYYASAANTPARLGIGTASQLLAVNSGATAPEWVAAPSSGGMTLLATLTLTGSSVTSSSFSSAYKQLFIYYKGVYVSEAANMYIRFNSDTGSNYYYRRVFAYDTTVATGQSQSQTSWRTGGVDTSSTAKNTANGFVTVMNPSDTDFVFGTIQHYRNNSGSDIESAMNVLLYDNSAAITTVTFYPESGTFSGGTAYVYGVN